MPSTNFKLAATLLALTTAFGAAACGDTGSDISDNTPDASTDSDADTGDTPAILIGVFVRNPDGRNIYVGAVPEVPSGELDYSSFLEFGDVQVTTHAGYVFVWDREPATMTRYSVGDDLSLTAGPTLSFLNQGVSGTAPTVYISETRAYTLSPALDTVVVWDPTAMEITGSIEVTPPERAEGISTSPNAGYLAGDQVIWPIASNNYDGENYFAGTAVAIASATDDTPVQIVEDTRCVGADGGYVDDKGDFYLRAGGYWGHTAVYGENAANVKTCMLRINAGETVFDPEYMVDFKELTGSYASFPWFHVTGSQYLALVWPSDTPVPESLDDFWNGEGLEPMLVDVESGESEPYPDVAGSVMVSTDEFEVDGVAYYQLSETGTAVGAVSEIVELTPEGTVYHFTLPEMWAFERIR